MADQEQALEFERVSKKFLAEKGKIKSVVDDLSFDVRPGEFFSILGPSGCGKTTCLRMISGLERPTSGIIRIAGRVVNEVHPNQRNVHTVFQKYALFPHLNIFENVAFGLRMKKRPESEIRSRVERMLEMVQLAQDAKRSVQQLSGGEQQRVALVRALVNEPAILLLDEPLAALDLKLREQMQQELSSLQKKLGTTFVFVTHDQAEALTLSDRVAIMNGGRIEQVGTPTEVYEKPATAFVARFVGTTNLFEGNIAVRPEKIRIRVTAPDAAQVASGTVRVLRGTLIERIYFGPTTQIKLHVGDALPPVIALVANQTAAKMPALKVGEKYYAVWDLADGVVVAPSRSGVESPMAVHEGVSSASVGPVLMGTESPTS